MATKNTASGYDYRFVEEPSSDLKCLICLCVAREPEQHGGGGCGKIYCRECIDEYKKKNSKCPNCRRDIITFKDVRSDRDIQSLKVRCENEQEGCEWVGELRSMEGHNQECGYELIPCSNGCKPKPSTSDENSDNSDSNDDNVLEVYRKDLEAHLEEECPLRDHTCPYCQKTDTYEYITGDHLDIFCLKMEIKCPHSQQCEAVLLREEEKTHLSICPYEEVPCKYKEFGCEVISLRKDLPNHEKDDQSHLHIAMDTVLSLKRDVSKLENPTSRGWNLPLTKNIINVYIHCKCTASYGAYSILW